MCCSFIKDKPPRLGWGLNTEIPLSKRTFGCAGGERRYGLACSLPSPPKKGRKKEAKRKVKEKGHRKKVKKSQEKKGEGKEQRKRGGGTQMANMMYEVFPPPKKIVAATNASGAGTLIKSCKNVFLPPI